MFDAWISRLRQAEGADDFRWFRVLERGSGGNNIHFHVLIGGLRDREKFWAQKWNALGGDGRITPYDSERDGILYLLKGMGDDGDLACDFLLPTNNKVRDNSDDLPRQTRTLPSSVRIDQIDLETTVKELKRLFKRFGRILEVGILECRDGDRTLMSATVTFADPYAAVDAERLLDGFKLRGLPIAVSILGE
jgi:RNA recognition motif. (a.k.a. RRM, RBD, or RNP domain)